MYIGVHRLRHHHHNHHPVGSSIWLAGVLRFAGQSMLLLFLLIYLFGLGFSPAAVLGYGVAFNLFALVLNHWVVGYLIAVVGPHKMIALSNLGLIAFAFGLYALPVSLPYLYALAGLQALSFESYFLSQHVYLAETAAKADTGKQVGHQFSVEPIGSLIGPLLGGLVAWIWSAQAVSFAAGFLLILSGILAFVFHDRSVKASRHYSHPKIWGIYRQLFKDWRNPLMVSGVISFDFIYQLYTLWAGVFVLLALESNSGYGLLGIFSFVGALFGLWAATWFGKQADRGRERKELRQSVVGETVVAGGRMAVNLLSQLGSLILLGVVSVLAWHPYEARSVAVYRRAYRLSERFADAKVEYSVCLENLGTLCRVVLFGLATVLSLFLDFEATLLICVNLVFLINLVFLMRPTSEPKA